MRESAHAGSRSLLRREWRPTNSTWTDSVRKKTGKEALLPSLAQLAGKSPNFWNCVRKVISPHSIPRRRGWEMNSARILRRSRKPRRHECGEQHRAVDCPGQGSCPTLAGRYVRRSSNPVCRVARTDGQSRPRSGSYHLKGTIIGEVVQDIDLSRYNRPRRGHIGFQHLSRENAPIEIRGARIEVLK